MEPSQVHCPICGKAGYKNELLILEITYGGMGHGPSWYTDLYGFDFGIGRELEV
jgi:hypothetical protein